MSRQAHVALYKLSHICLLLFSSFFLPLVPILKNNILTIQGFANSRAAVNNSNFTDISTLQSLLKHKDSTASLSTTEADDQLFAMIQLEKSMLLKTKASSSSPPPTFQTVFIIRAQRLCFRATAPCIGRQNEPRQQQQQQDRSKRKAFKRLEATTRRPQQATATHTFLLLLSSLLLCRH